MSICGCITQSCIASLLWSVALVSLLKQRSMYCVVAKLQSLKAFNQQVEIQMYSHACVSDSMAFCSCTLNLACSCKMCCLVLSTSHEWNRLFRSIQNSSCMILHLTQSSHPVMRYDIRAGVHYFLYRWLLFFSTLLIVFSPKVKLHLLLYCLYHVMDNQTASHCSNNATNVNSHDFI